VEPHVAFGRYADGDDPMNQWVCLDPEVVPKVRHHMFSASRNGKVTGNDPGLLERVDARSVENRNRKAILSISQIFGGAIIPPKPDRAANRPRIKSAYAAQEQRVNQPAPNKAGAVDAREPLAAPEIPNPLVAP